MKRLLSLIALASLVACGTQTSDLGSTDTGPACANPCDCCADGEVCFAGACCAPTCAGKTCGSDGCGGSCGSCDPGWQCTAAGSCECTPDTDDELCDAKGIACGDFTGNDRCGRARTISCDRCVAPKTCHPDSGACLCDAETDEILCADNHAACGALTATDRCGVERTLASCGTCAANQTCTAGACICTGETAAQLCQAQNAECGTITATDACGASRTVGCGTCAAGLTCDASHRCACVPETDAAFCSRLNAACGPLTATDNCNRPRTVANCGPCAATETCTANSCVLCNAETDTAFCARVGKNCGPLGADDNCGVPRTVASCGSCVWPQTCDPVAQLCGIAPPPPNDSCLSPTLLTFTGAGTLSATAVGDTAGANSTAQGSCAGSGVDVVYKFVVPPGSNYSAQATLAKYAGSPLVPSVYIRSTCDDPSTELACAFSSTPLPAVASARLLVPGEYYVWVDNRAATSAGPFELTLTLTPRPAPPSNDSCASPTALALAGVGSSVTVTGDNTEAINDSVGRCAATNGGDLVYSVTPTANMDLGARVVRTGTSALTPTIYLRTSCASGAAADQLACGSPAPSTASGDLDSASVLVHNLQRGVTYFLIVDSVSDSYGTFTLTANSLPPVPPPGNDLCAAPTPLNFDAVTRAAAVVGSTVGAMDDSTGSCGAMDGPDVVYSFQLSAPALVSAVVTRDAATPGFVPAIYIRTACASASGADQRACGADVAGASSSGAASATANNLPAGTYYVIVDGLNHTEGSFALTLRQSPPVANYTCATAQPLAVDPTTRTVTVVSDNSLGTNSTSSSCGPSATSGKEVFFSFDIAGHPQTATVTVAPVPRSAFVANPSIRSACGQPSTELACGAPAFVTNAVTLKPKNLAVGTYSIVVDSMDPLQTGPFALTLTLSDPPAVAANDSCAAPIALLPDATGLATATGDLDAALADYDGSCRAGGGGADLVYMFDVTSPQGSGVQITLTPTAGAALKGTLYLRRDCATAASEVRCSGTTTTGGPVSIASPRLAMGTYYLIVDAYSANDTGPFQLSVQFSAPPPPPANDVCAGAQTLVFDNSGVASAVGNTGEGLDDYGSNCAVAGAPLTGPDLVYKFDLTAPAAVTARVSRDTYNTTYKPAVSIRSSCAASTELVCARDTTNGVSDATVVLPAGTYYVFVDGVSTSTNGSGFGPFTLVVTQSSTMTAGDSCGNPGAITLDATGAASITGTLSGATRSGDSNCLQSSGNDLVYTLTLAQERAVTVTAVGSSQTHPAVYLRRSCDDPRSELGCNYQSQTSATATFTLNRVPAGTYYLWIDGGTQYDVGAFTVSVTTNAPTQAVPANDTCTGAIALDLAAGNGGAQALGDTSFALDDYAGSCGTPPYPHSSPEVVYRFTLAQPATVDANVIRDPSGESWFPALYLRTDCANPAPTAEVACSTGTAAGGAALSQQLAAGTYYLFVDGQQGTGGKFVLSVAARSAIPQANDTCASAQALTFGANGVAVATGTTANMANDGTGTCAASSTAADAVYSFTLAATRRVTIDVTSGAANRQPLVYLQAQCGVVASERGCAFSTATFGGAEIQAGNLAAGTYYVWVDGANASSGPYTLAVRADVPPQGPSNDACTSALALAFTNGAATSTGDTTDASDDDTSNCATATAPLSGGDVVYSFTLSAQRSVTATVTRSGASSVYKPAVSIRSSCGATDELACARDTAGASSVTLTLDTGTYYVIVDGVGSTGGGTQSGGFTLQLTTAAPVHADGCGNVEPIVLDPSTGVATITGDLTSSTSSTDGSCGAGSGNDVVYSLAIGRDKTVKVTLTPTGFNPAVYLRRGCDNAATELGCGFSTIAQPASFTINQVPSGTYFIWVDTTNAGVGPYTLKVEATDPAAPAPANDTCANPQALALDPVNNSARVTGNLALATNDYAGTCTTASNPHSGADMVYSFTLAQAMTVYAVVVKDPTATSFYPALYLRSTCASGAAIDELGCAMTANGSSASVTKQLAAGTYYLVVDGQSGSAGKFTLDLVARASVNTNDSCATAEPIALDANGFAVVGGTTSGLTNDSSGSCYAASTAPDAVYSLTLATTQDVTFQVDPGSTVYPALYVQGTCGVASSEVFCKSAASPASLYFTRRLAAGTWYIFMDGTYAATYAGPYAMAIWAVEPPPTPANAVCAGATPLAFTSAHGPQTVTLSNLDLSYGVDDYSGNCAPSVGADLVYSFTTTEARSFVATLAANASSYYKPVIYLRSTCGQSSPASEVTCNAASVGGTSTRIVVNNLAAGTWYLIVDGDQLTTTDLSGHFDLTATLDAPFTQGPANDNCPAAQPITLTGGIGSTTIVNGTTLGAADDSTGTCAATGAPDVVYSFTLPVAAKVSAKVDPGTGFAPAVAIRSACGTSYRRYQNACASTTTATTAVTATANTLHPGTYYVWVDGGSTNSAIWSGTFTLTITLAAPTGTPPANDSCAGVIPLAFGAAATGDTTYATNDYDWGWSTATGCLPSPSTTDGSGNELVWSYTPIADGAFKVTMAPTNSCNAALWIGTDTCGDLRSCMAGRDAGNPETITVTNGLAGKTYFIYTEGYTASTNCVFTVTVTGP